MVISFNIENFKHYYNDTFAKDLSHFLSEYRKYDSMGVLLGFPPQKVPDKKEQMYGCNIYSAKTTNTLFDTSNNDENICYYAVCFSYLQNFMSIMNRFNLEKNFARITGYPIILSETRRGDLFLGAFETMAQMQILPYGKDSQKSLHECILQAYAYMMYDGFIPFIQGRDYRLQNNGDYTIIVDKLRNKKDEVEQIMKLEIMKFDLHTFNDLTSRICDIQSDSKDLSYIISKDTDDNKWHLFVYSSNEKIYSV